MNDLFLKASITDCIIDLVLECIERGAYTRYKVTEHPTKELAMTLSVEISGIWYHIEFFNFGPDR